MGKKGITLNLTMVLIISIVLLLILVPFIINSFLKMQASTVKDICKASVASNALLRIGKQELVSKLECYTQDLTIETRDPDAMKKQLAGYYADCFDQFWQGKYELFSEDGIYCHICSTITFAKPNQKIQGFKRYLFEKTMPRKEITYAQFLSGYQTPGAAVLGAQQTSLFEEDELDTSQTYAPIFVYIRGRDQILHYAETIGAYAAGTSLIVLGMGIAVKGIIITATTFWTVKGAIVGVIVTTTGLLITTAGIIIDVWNYFFGGEETEWMAFTQFVEYSPETLKALGCEKKISVAERR